MQRIGGFWQTVGIAHSLVNQRCRKLDCRLQIDGDEALFWFSWFYEWLPWILSSQLSCFRLDVDINFHVTLHNHVLPSSVTRLTPWMKRILGDTMRCSLYSVYQWTWSISCQWILHTYISGCEALGNNGLGAKARLDKIAWRSLYKLNYWEGKVHYSQIYLAG